MISTAQHYTFPLAGESSQSNTDKFALNGQSVSSNSVINSNSRRSRTPSLTLSSLPESQQMPPILPTPVPSTAQNSSHSRKNRKQRGLSISSGVSYTNFYNKVQPNSHFDLPRLDEYSHFSTSSAHPVNSKKAALSAWLARFDLKIISLCALWYISSIISSNLSKSILKNFRYPVTLTEIQFFLASLLCLLTFKFIHKNKSFAQSFPLGTFPAQITTNISLYDTIKPTRLILVQTVPMGMFQFVGHITSHNATSLISVAMVHTVKALSPIVTVLSYRFLFHVHYPLVTYITLIPLMVGIMLTCLFKSSSKHLSDSLSSSPSDHFNGLLFAFVSMIIFVSQNIFAKRILTYKTNLLRQDDENGTENLLPIDRDEELTMRKISEKKKIDKLTILFYCSIVGFIFTFPIYISSELFSNTSFSLFDLSTYIICLMLFHGIIHFFQALLAFHILGLVTPVSYSIANIFKRIVVILAALIWEAQPINSVQGVGLTLTMLGLYAYDRWGNNKPKL